MNGGNSFGFFTQQQDEVTFSNLRARVFREYENHPRSPENPNSPNYPRAKGRPKTYKNPILGDPGNGSIGRWNFVNLDAVENVVEQMIEHYLRDRKWYANVRCREALWNMYRRIAWWVTNEVDPSMHQYDRALFMIRDCIENILTRASEPDRHYGLSDILLPSCPAPYTHTIKTGYLNHFDGKAQEKLLFSTSKLPKYKDIPGFFRYVSASEEQEWELVNSVGSSPMSGEENIMKLSLDRLKVTNSSKITFTMRFKKKGYIRFKVLADTLKGNGLNFFINGQQVGGEWSEENGWRTLKYNISSGQTYKFDWLVRKREAVERGTNAVYIKDVECVEVIEPAAFHPGDWVYTPKKSYVRAACYGSVPKKTRTFTYNLHLDEDSRVEFGYCVGASIQPTPKPKKGYKSVLEFYVDNKKVTEFPKRMDKVLKYAKVLKKGNHQLKWVFTTYSTGNVWDYAEIHYVTADKYYSEQITVTPYCEKFGGDKCVEALILCLLGLIKARKKPAVIGKKIWLVT